MSNNSLYIAKKGVQSKKATFSMPIKLINSLDDYCKENDLSKSKFISHLVEQALMKGVESAPR